MEEKPRILPVRILVDVVHSPRVEGPGAADDPVHLVAFCQEELGEIRAVLPRDAGDESFFHSRFIPLDAPVELNAFVPRPDQEPFALVHLFPAVHEHSGGGGWRSKGRKIAQAFEEL